MPNAIIGWLWLDALVFGRARYLTREVLGYVIAITELPTLLRIAEATARRSSVGQETFLIMAEITKKETKKNQLMSIMQQIQQIQQKEQAVAGKLT